MERIAEGEAISEMADARRFNEYMGGNRFLRQEYAQLARELAGMGVQPGGRVLDVGTGPGFVAIQVARLLQGSGCQVVGLDLSEAMLALARENAARRGLDGVMTWRLGDARAMPFEDGEFDALVCNHSLHHWEEPRVVFDEIARVLKEDGIGIVRDTKRLEKWGPRFLSWAIGRAIPADFRMHYVNSIKASYTAPELTRLLEGSKLRGWHLVEDLMDLVVVKEG